MTLKPQQLVFIPPKKTGGDAIASLVVERELLDVKSFAGLRVVSRHPYCCVNELTRYGSEVRFEIRLSPDKAPAYPAPLHLEYTDNSGTERLVDIPVNWDTSEDNVTVVPTHYFTIVPKDATGAD